MSLAYSYVRWSSDKQTTGDSERRQTELAAAYAKRHHLTLATTSYRDAGISAFRGKNAAEGALAAFLKACDAGVIKQGDVLLIESFDRLSRAPVQTALRLFQDIVDRGVEIVTLSDNQRYSTASINTNWTQLIMALAVMARANEESARKGERVKAAWDAKRDSGHILTAVGPAWLQLSKDRSEWKMLPKKVQIVQQVFDLATSGLGAPTIARRLNEGRVQTLRTASFWSAGLVSGLLKNEAVMGTLNRKRAKAEPITSYYPPIIDAKTFDAVQAMIKTRRRTGGPKGPVISNLFSGLLRCECGRRAKFVSGAKPHLYLQCEGAYSGSKVCDAGKMPYKAVEETIMEWLLLVEEHDFTRPSVLSDPRIVLRSKVADVKAETSNALEVLAKVRTATAQAALAARLDALAAEQDKLERALKDAVPAPRLQERVKSALLMLKEHARLQKVGGVELHDLRERLRSGIKGLISEVLLVKERKETKHGHFGYLLVRGELVDQSNDGAARSLYRAGGLLLEYELTPWGFFGSRRTRTRVFRSS